MTTENIHSEALGHEEKEPFGHIGAHAPARVHEWEPLDQSYNLVVRTVLWVVVGALLAGFVVWWAMT
jgi:hypothetical protein